MPHITLPQPVPGLLGLLSFKPSLGAKIGEFAQELLRGPSPLSVGERELIAAYVSSLNSCAYCVGTHTAAAAHAYGGDYPLVEAVKVNPALAPVDEKMRVLLAIAGKIQADARTVTDADIEAAKAAGADEETIHDAVLIAAAFCMVNRYVDGLGAIVPEDPAVFDMTGKFLVANGYLGPRP